MPVIRAFIAIEIPKPIQEQLDVIICDLKGLTKSTAIRWILSKNIHITLKFLGDVSISNVDLLSEMLKNEVVRYPQFKLNIDGFGAFPSLLRPRVIWIGVSTTPELQALQNGVEAETNRLGYSPEQRVFSPHLTLARLSHKASPIEIRRVGKILSNFKVEKVGSYEVKNVILFKSDLLPGGPIYTPISTFKLKLKSQVVQ